MIIGEKSAAGGDLDIPTDPDLSEMRVKVTAWLNVRSGTNENRSTQTSFNECIPVDLHTVCQFYVPSIPTTGNDDIVANVNVVSEAQIRMGH